MDVEVTPLPSGSTIIVNSTSDGAMTLSWSSVTSADSYHVYRRTLGGIWPTTPVATTSDTTITLINLTNGSTYHHRVTFVDTDGIESDFNPVVTSLPIVAPDVVVTPLSMRRAKLSWDRPTANPVGTQYQVEITRPSLPPAHETALVTPLPTTVLAPITSLHLDTMFKNYGLDDFDWFDLRLKVTTPSGEVIYGTFTRLIDNPIARVSGHGYNPLAGTEQGEARVIWPRMPDARGVYTISYFEWDENGTLSPVARVEYRDGNPSGSTRTFLEGKLANGLDLQSVYGLQLSYATAEGMVVSSGRNAFVWPSKEFPARGTRVATFPFFGHWTDREYNYMICKSTFPSEDRQQWVDLISHAFEQWEIASDGLVKMTASTTRCIHREKPIEYLTAIFPNFLLDINAIVDGILSEVAMVDTSGWGAAEAIFTEFPDDPLTVCVYQSRACVVSWALLNPLQQASVGLSGAGPVGVGVDVLINKDRAYQDGRGALSIPGSDNRPSDDDIRFNSCRAGTDDLGELIDFSNYELMVHEAGHALGLSGYVIWDSPLSRPTIEVNAHPSIQPAVMNQIVNEPECSPHPLDILAINALYQKLEP